MRLLALAAALVACLAPGAHAGSDSTYRGGCSYSLVREDPNRPGWMLAEFDVMLAAYSPTATSNPVQATVTCYLRIDGVEQPSVVVASGTVVVAGAGTVTYPETGDVFPIPCQRVDFTGPGDSTPTDDTCDDGKFDETHAWLWNEVDPVACPAFVAAQGAYGPVDVNEQGDVYLAGEPLYDCPPHDIEWGRR